jgi:FkbM family methyltransferase
MNPEQNGEYEVANRLIPACSTIFDVGANIGNWSRYISSINQQARIHCFEPSLKTFATLHGLTRIENIMLNRTAMGSKRGKAKLYVYESEQALNTLHRRKGITGMDNSVSQQTEIVRVETIDNYCLKKRIEQIDFLKLDVEGHELEVLKGAMGLLRRQRIRWIQFEYGGCNIDSRTFLKDFFQLFSEQKYFLYKIYPTTIQFIANYSQQLETFQYQNWLASRDSLDWGS